MSHHRKRSLGPGFSHTGHHCFTVCQKKHVDHNFFDTTSILRFLTRRFDLPLLEGLQVRNAAFAAQRALPPGDLTSTLKF
jgi:acid phosphatase